MRHKSIFVDVVCDTYFNRLGKTFLFQENVIYTYRHTNNFVSGWKEKVGGKKLNISNERKNDVMMFMEFENF